MRWNNKSIATGWLVEKQDGEPFILIVWIVAIWFDICIVEIEPGEGAGQFRKTGVQEREDFVQVR